MASCEIKNPPEFTVEVEKWNRETLADGAAMGAEMEKLLNNTYYNKIQAEQLEEGKVGRNGGDISETRVKTLEAPQEEFPVPQAGEGVKTFFGKVKKSLEDWKNFKDGIITLGKLVNNGQCTEPGFALDARYGKTLAEQVAQLNSNITNLQVWNIGKEIRYLGSDTINCNDITDHYILGKGENFPSAAFFYVETIAYQLNVNGTVKTGKQIAWEYQGGSNFARHAFNGVWSAWIPYVTTNDITSDFTASVIQDLNSPTMAINSYLNNVSNPPNGYQTGGKVISVMDSNGELGAQLSLTRGYSHPQYRYKDNNGWSAWKNVFLASDMANLRGYYIYDTDYTDSNIKAAVEHYYWKTVDSNTNYVIQLGLLNGITYHVDGIKIDTNNGTAMVSSYGMASILYGRRYNGTWIWTEK